jgi:hypothetical protein
MVRVRQFTIFEAGLDLLLGYLWLLPLWRWAKRRRRTPVTDAQSEPKLRSCQKARARAHVTDESMADPRLVAGIAPDYYLSGCIVQPYRSNG